VSAEADVHQVVLELAEPIPADVPIGSEIVVKARVSCRRGCDLDGRLVTVVTDEESVATFAHEELSVRAPVKVGTYSWTLLFLRQQIGGVVHEQASLSIAFATRPLASSLAVWDVASPVVMGERFTVKVGAKSAAACGLEGATVEILDEGGTVVGSARLGGTPWEGTRALHWTDVELPAPLREGIVSWLARFPATDIPLPHTEAEARFSVAAVGPPECRLTIVFADKETEEPIENAHIRLGAFRAITDARGRAELSIPVGRYEVKVWHPAYETPSTEIDVNGDLALQLPGVNLPEEDPSARWMM
jgi:hypothetical protein